MIRFVLSAVLLTFPITALGNRETNLHCQEPGLFAHPTDCERFVSCWVENGKLQQTILSCAEGQGFDESLKQCIAKKYVNSCGKSEKEAETNVKRNQNTEYNISSRNRHCSSAGIMCANCTSLVACIPGSNGGFSEFILDTCTTSQPCNDNNHSCGGYCTYCEFKCAKEGRYPDLNDCSVYHICDAQLKDTAFTCEPGYVYNPETTICEASYNCELIKPCKGVGDSGGYPQDSHIYYYCAHNGASVCPSLFHCPGNQYFNPSNQQCQDDEPTTPADSTVGETEASTGSF